ncbi:MAG TPA: tetratricopeptide repeat protein, partial [Kofleriaceae bacterium]
LRVDHELTAWRLFEEGVGWLELGHPHTALSRFEEALCYDALAVAHEGKVFALAELGAIPEPSAARRDIAPDMDSHRSQLQRPSNPIRATKAGVIAKSEDLEREALQLEAQRAFAAALNMYRGIVGGNATTFTGRARCHLALGEHGEAIDYAQRALAIDNAHAEALSILTTAMLRRGWLEEALRNAERLVALEASGRAHYLRGKALFSLGRMVDARDAFEQAGKLDPQLLEAQLLRREVERVTGNVRQSVGKQHAPTFDIPDQLAELRDVLVSGDTNAAVTALRDDRYARDADAQLLLARFLAFDNRLDEAIAVYDQLAATSHRIAALVGKATALLELGRPGDALSIFEQLPDEPDAAEGQARALEALGRIDEAAEAYRRFIALATSGAGLRVRAAELALDNIAARRRGSVP